MKPTPKRPGTGNGSSATISRQRLGKPIAKTVEMLRSNELAKRNGKGKERAVLSGLNEVIKACDNLPGAVQVERFAEARALEVAALQSAVKIAAANNTSRAFQSLPRHLRRRAASHNPRRVPKYLKNRAAAEIDPGDIIVRLQRRKAKLRARGDRKGQSRTEQLRLRQRGKSWLATHMYHAKRFRMTDIWGYRVPRTPTLKSFRSSFRAARHKALLRDTSYFGVIELESTRKVLIDILRVIVGCGAFIGEKYEGGSYSAIVQLYKSNQFPRGLIGPAELLWRRMPDACRDDAVKLWLRVHPSISEETWSLLKPLCNGRCELRDLRSELESFELTGPFAGAAIHRTLAMSASVPESDRLRFAKVFTGDPAEVPDNLVFSFTATDPRLAYPPPRSSSVQTSSSEPFDADAPSVDLWSRPDRLKLSTPTFKKADLDKRRAKGALLGLRLMPTCQDDRIPVMIIKRQIGSNDDRTAMFHGYSILFPKGWAMAILPSLVYCGVKLSGTRENEVLCREAGVPSFPEHYGAVCFAGEQYEDAAAKEAEQRWMKRPPGKRTDFSALKVNWPFKPDWAAVLLVRNLLGSVDGQKSSERREEEVSNSTIFRPWLLEASLFPFLEQFARSQDPAFSLLSAINAFRQRRRTEPIPASQGRALLRTCLCHVRVTMVGRGSLSDLAMVCSIDATERSTWPRREEHDAVETSQNRANEHGLGENGRDMQGVMGFVTTGNISLTRGVGYGNATVTLAGYLDALRAARCTTEGSQLPIVRVRNRNSCLYRLAYIQPVQSS